MTATPPQARWRFSCNELSWKAGAVQFTRLDVSGSGRKGRRLTPEVSYVSTTQGRLRDPVYRGLAAATG